MTSVLVVDVTDLTAVTGLILTSLVEQGRMKSVLHVTDGRLSTILLTTVLVIESVKRKVSSSGVT
tara:strand:+ start:305 stop:499 length:195 start_codon:yes stop_codon:yes gene_type:complete